MQATITGYHIHATDGEIGHVEDFMVDDENWAIRFLVVANRNWLPGKKVILSPRWIKRVQWADSLVYFDLTRESVENSLEFNPSKPISRDCEAFLLDHFGQSMQKKNDHEEKKNTSKGEEKWQKKWKFISAKFAEISLKCCMAVTVNWSAAASR